MTVQDAERSIAVARSFTEEASGSLRAVANLSEQNPFMAHSAFQREVDPILSKARRAIDQAFAALGEADDFSQVEDALGDLCWADARLCDAMITQKLREFASVGAGDECRDMIFTYTKRSRERDEDALFLLRTTSRLFNVALDHAEAGRAGVALSLLNEAERFAEKNDPVSTRAGKKKFDLLERDSRLQPVPLGMPGQGRLLHELCDRWPSYRRNTEVARHRVLQAMMAEDRVYLEGLFEFYENKPDTTDEQLLSILALGYQSLNDWFGPDKAMTRGLRIAKRVKPESRGAVADLMKDRLFSQLAAAGAKQGSVLAAMILDLKQDRETEEKIGAWFATGTAKGPVSEWVSAGEELVGELASPVKKAVRDRTQELMASRILGSRLEEWSGQLDRLFKLGTPEPALVEQLLGAFARSAGVTPGILALGVGQLLASRLSGEAAETARGAAVSAGFAFLERGRPAEWLEACRGILTLRSDHAVQENLATWFERGVRPDSLAESLTVGEELTNRLDEPWKNRVRNRTALRFVEKLEQSPLAEWPVLLERLFAQESPGAVVAEAILRDFGQKARTEGGTAPLVVGKILIDRLPAMAEPAREITTEACHRLLDESVEARWEGALETLLGLRTPPAEATCTRLIRWLEGCLPAGSSAPLRLGGRLAGSLPAPHGQTAASRTGEEVFRRLSCAKPGEWGGLLEHLGPLRAKLAGAEDAIASAFVESAGRGNELADLERLGTRLNGELKGEARERVRVELRRQFEQAEQQAKGLGEKLRHARSVAAFYPEDGQVLAHLEDLSTRQLKARLIMAAAALAVIGVGGLVFYFFGH